MSLKWSETVMMKFLELYHKHDCLWNHRTDKYRNRDARENALESIVKEMEISGLTIADLKNKIKTIRTMYKKEHSLVCKSIKSGMGTEELYVPKLFWYKRADIFLKGVTNTRDTSSNLDLQHDEAESQTMQDNAGETEKENELPPSSPSSASLSVTASNSQEEAISIENIETANPATPKQSKTSHAFRAPQNRKRKISGNENIVTISAAIDKLDQVVHKNTSDDEFDIFAKHIALQLRKMPLYDALMCQEQIQTVIREKRLQLLTRESQYQYYLSPTSSTHSNIMNEEQGSSNQSFNRQYVEDSQLTAGLSLEDFRQESNNTQTSLDDSQDTPATLKDSQESSILTKALRGLLNLE